MTSNTSNEHGDSITGAISRLLVAMQRLPHPEREAVSLLAAAGLVEEAAYEMARHTTNPVVSRLILVAAELERTADVIAKGVDDGDAAAPSRSDADTVVCAFPLGGRAKLRV